MNPELILQELRGIREGQDRFIKLLEMAITSKEKTVSSKVFYVTHFALSLSLMILSLHVIEAKKIRINNYEIEIESQRNRAMRRNNHDGRSMRVFGDETGRDHQGSGDGGSGSNETNPDPHGGTRTDI
jgi:hypothetical protein